MLFSRSCDRERRKREKSRGEHRRADRGLEGETRPGKRGRCCCVPAVSGVRILIDLSLLFVKAVRQFGWLTFQVRADLIRESGGGCGGLAVSAPYLFFVCSCTSHSIDSVGVG